MTKHFKNHCIEYLIYGVGLAHFITFLSPPPNEIMMSLALPINYFITFPIIFTINEICNLIAKKVKKRCKMHKVVCITNFLYKCFDDSNIKYIQNLFLIICYSHLVFLYLYFLGCINEFFFVLFFNQKGSR